MTTVHKWANEIKAWADGATVQVYCCSRWQLWTDVHDGLCPDWGNDNYCFRIKPEPQYPVTSYSEEDLISVFSRYSVEGKGNLTSIANAAIKRYIIDTERNKGA